MKKCSRCKIDKDLNSFTPSKHCKDGYAYTCRSCNALHKIEAKRRRELGLPSLLELKKANPKYGGKTNPRYGALKELKYKYGLEAEDYNELFNKQLGCCAICNKHQSQFKKRLSVDHNHVTGKVRQLLCPHCNHGLGNFLDDIDLLKSAILYLENNT